MRIDQDEVIRDTVLLRLLIAQSEADVQTGRVVSQGEVFNELRRRLQAKR